MEVTNKSMSKIGLGGSCHWCTEAIFQSLKGVENVQQGWIRSIESPTFSEAVIVHFDTNTIDHNAIIDIHLKTHSSSSNHTMRDKYRSAIYAFDSNQFQLYEQTLNQLQNQFENNLITKVLHFESFKINTENYLDYYRKNPEKPFCKNIIRPKLTKLKKEFSLYIKE